MADLSISVNDMAEAPSLHSADRRVEWFQSFPMKLHLLLSESDARMQIISLSPDGKSYVVHNKELLVKRVLPWCVRIRVRCCKMLLITTVFC
jgi:hypothetical protein